MGVWRWPLGAALTAPAGKTPTLTWTAVGDVAEGPAADVPVVRPLPHHQECQGLQGGASSSSMSITIDGMLCGMSEDVDCHIGGGVVIETHPGGVSTCVARIFSLFLSSVHFKGLHGDAFKKKKQLLS